MKRTQTEARKNLVINGELLESLLDGGVTIDYNFNGWDWAILVKLSKPTDEGFDYAQFETIDSDTDFYLMVSRNGSKRGVINSFRKDISETRRSKNRAFELGNIA